MNEQNSHLVLSIITPNQLLEENQSVIEIKVPAYHGEMGIFPGHAPLVTTLSEGILSYKKNTKDLKHIALSWGYLEISPTGVVILAETAERAEEIEKTRAETSLKASEMKLKNIHQLSPEEIKNLQKRMKRAKARIRAFDLWSKEKKQI